MVGYLLLALLGIGAVGGLTFGLDDNDDDNAGSTPSTPDDEDEGQNPDNTDGNDLLQGAMTDDTLTGGDGDDRLIGLGGDDQVSGDAGADHISGDDGDDTLAGGDGDDGVYGGAGGDIALGGAGNDDVWGGSDADLLVGGEGEDTMNGASGDDVLIGTQTDLEDGSVSDFIAGLSTDGITDPEQAFLSSLGLSGPGADGDAGDQMNGGTGDDTMLLGSEDTATGGDGNDFFLLGDWIQAGRAAEILDFNPDEDMLAFTYEGDTAPEVSVTDDGAGNAIVSADGQVIANVNGAAGSITPDDIIMRQYTQDDETNAGITGTDAAEALEGTETDDVVSALGGNDIIFGLAGNDIIRGNEGDDIVLGGDGDDRAFGNEGEDVMIGGPGDDFLRGGADDDSLIDGRGSDTIRGDTGDDVIISSGFLDEDALVEEALAQASAATDLNDAIEATVDAGNLDFSQDTDPDGDMVFGGTGEDAIIAGLNDTVSGGSGADAIVFTDAVSAGNGPVTVTDFELGEDTLIYATNPVGPIPTITVAYSEGATATSGDATVLANGNPVSVVQGVGTSFTAADITLAQSSI